MTETKFVTFRARPVDLERIERITEYLRLYRPDTTPERTATIRYALAEIDRLITESLSRIAADSIGPYYGAYTDPK